MARWGYRAVNRATGSVQIDDQWANLALRQKSTVTTGSGAVSTGTVSFSSASMPLIALRAAVPVAILTVARSGSTWTWTLAAKGASVAITVYIFDEPTDLGAGWGTRIKRGGSVIYDSRHRYARVDYRFSGASYEPSSPPAYSLASGKTYAIAPGRFSGINEGIAYPWESGNWDFVATIYGLAVKIDGTALTSEELVLSSTSSSGSGGSPSGWLYDYRSYDWWVLDVTNY